MSNSDVFIADILVDFVNRQLVYQSQTRQLEPKVFKLLEVLLDSDGDLVSREQLNEKVWDGRVVGEGAINRTVSLLRQHFAAFDSERDFIVTVPKAGYKLQFINKKQPTSAVKSNKVHWQGTWLIVAVGLLVFIGAVIWFDSDKKQPLLTFETASRVSALKGAEYNISVDENSEMLVYTRWLDQDQTTQMEMKSIKASGSVSILGENNAQIFSQQLSPNGQVIAYAYREHGRCQIAIYQVAEKQTKDIHQCATDSVPSFTWHWNNEDLYFRERIDKTQPYTVSRYNLSTGRLSMMSLPPSDGNVKGDYLISHHAEHNKLLIVRYVDENLGNLLVLDSFNGSKLYDQKIPLHIDSAVWLSGELIALADKNKVYTYDISSESLIEQFSTPLPVTSMAATDSTLFYSMISHVSHLVKYQLPTGNRQVIDNANAQAQLPRLSAQNALAYLSDKTGERKLHIVSAVDNQSRILADLSMSLGFDRFEWSADSRYLLLSRQGAVFRLDVNSQKLEQLLDDSSQAYVVNFGANSDDIIYGSNRSGQWQLWRYNVNTKQDQQLTTRGGYSGRTDGSSLYFTKFAQSGLWKIDLLTGEEFLVIEDVDIINWLNWQLVDQFVYFYRPKSGIWRYDLSNDKEQLMLPYNNKMLHQFSVSLDHQDIYVVESEAIEGDIYKVGYYLINH